MGENEWLAMRGLVDIVIGALLIGRFFWYSSQIPSRRARIVQLTILTLLIALLELLGVWSWREIKAAATLFPVVWPLVGVALYFIYRTVRLWYKLQQARFEIDWRREYQEVLMKQLEQSGHPVLNHEEHEDNKTY